MSENKVPPEFEWIKPGVKAVYRLSVCIIDTYPWQDSRGDWYVGIDEYYIHKLCADLKPVQQPITITLTLTSEQAEALLRGVNTGYLESGATMAEIKKQIEEKLK